MGGAAAIVRLEPRAEEAHLKTIQLDDTDIDIIRRLQYDGRLPFTQIAADLSISEGAVRRRVKRLTESGLLQIVAVVEPQFLGWNAAGMIGVTVQSGQVDAVAHRIAQFREVSYLFMVSYCRDMDHFVSFLSQELQQVPGVVHTRTFMILKMYKLSYRWGEAEPQRVNRQPAIDLESP
jgi:Lrp/AsnC family transcriptional regulator for asnA, asnC and gidA